MQAYTSAKLLMDAAKEQLTSPGTTAKLREFAKQGISADARGLPFIGSTGSSLFQDALGLNSSLMTKVKRNMGDCFRIADFLNRYNAFDEDMNLAVARKKVFKIQIPDASLGGERRAWSGTAQGVSGSDSPAGEPFNNNITPQVAIKPQTTGDARRHDDAQSTKPPCPGNTPMGQSPPKPAATGSGAAATTPTNSATGANAKNINETAKKMIGTSTKNVPGTEGGNLGCCAGVSMMYKQATGEDILPGKPIVIDTAEAYARLSNDSRFEKLPVSQGRGGDIIITARGKEHGHAGVIVDGGRIVSNSSKGAVLRDDYTIDGWNKHISKRNPTQTHVFRRK